MSSDNKDKLLNRREIDWLCVIFNLHIIVSCILGIHFAINEAFLRTTAFSIFLILLSLIGATAGAHRLWAHQSYKATLSLRIFLMICQTITSHTSIYEWVRLHRLHHKHFGQNLDPYSTSNGFFYSHFIANNLKLSQAQEQALKDIDMSDIEKDGVVMFQKRFYWLLFVVVSLLLPINAPVEYWNESILNSVFIVGWLRYGITYHLLLLIHSAFNVFDLNHRDCNSFDSNIVFLVNKTHWLSYHYLLPWDYQTSEYGKYGNDCTSKFIRVCAALELASDLKTVDNQMVQEALSESAIEAKSFIQVIEQMHQKYQKKINQHYLMPSKFY